MEYNNCKAFIDLSDQKKGYNYTLRRCVKRYRKLVFKFLLGGEVLQKILDTKEASETEENSEERKQHHESKNTGKRLRCVMCYAQRVEEIERQNAQNKTPRSPWGCNICGHNFFVTYFFLAHHKAKKAKILLVFYVI